MVHDAKYYIYVAGRTTNNKCIHLVPGRTNIVIARVVFREEEGC